MEFQEGYVDGLVGIGLQDRAGLGSGEYMRGFILGSLDRKDMLKNNS